MTQKEALAEVLDALEALNVPYMVVGAFASNYWGRPRSTRVADVVVEISPAQAAELARLLRRSFHTPDFVIREAVERRGHFYLIHLAIPFKVDLWVLPTQPYDQESFRRRHQGKLLDRPMCLASAEDTILSKLLGLKTSPAQQRDFQDALEVYATQLSDLDQSYLDEWAAALGVVEPLAQIREQAAEEA
jgi:hypothetical protein